MMATESRRLARNLFPESPSRSNDSLSSENTLGPMSPLSTPEKSKWSATSSLKKSSAMLRRSPRHITKSKSVLNSSIASLNTTLVGETPYKDEPVIQKGLMTPNVGQTQNLGQILNTPVKNGKLFIEESPATSYAASENVSPQIAAEKSPERQTNVEFSPKKGFPCSMFYAKPKAKLSLFADYVVKRPIVVAGKRKRSESLQKGHSSSRRRYSKRAMYGEINKNVWHGIKKPKFKKVKLSNDTLVNRNKGHENGEEGGDIEMMVENEQPKTISQPRTPKKLVSQEIGKPIVKLPSPVADPNKKFFKTNRTLEINRLATVTVDKNIKLAVSNGIISLQRSGKKSIKTQARPKVHQPVEPVFEPMCETEDSMKQDVQQKVDSILFQLEEDDMEVQSKENDAMLINSITTSPSMKQDVQQKVDSICFQLEDDMELQSRENDAMLINSITTSPSVNLLVSSPVTPSAFENLNMSITPDVKSVPICSAETIHHDVAALDIVSPQSTSKLFPIFSKEYTPQLGDQTKSPQSTSRSLKRTWHQIGDDQYQIDAGQRRFGATQCYECGLVYQYGDPEDEQQHLKYHGNYSQLKFMGWKSERVVNEYDTGRVLGIYPGDPKMWRNKVAQVLEVVDRELGSEEIIQSDLAQKKVYLYVAGRRIVGCLVAESITQGFRMLSDVAEIDCCSSEPTPILCGVSRLWTVTDWRRKNIATRLVDSMRSNFIFGCILAKNEFAFSVPTMMGKDFAKRYTATPEYLVYS